MSKMNRRDFLRLMLAGAAGAAVGGLATREITKPNTINQETFEKEEEEIARYLQELLDTINNGRGDNEKIDEELRFFLIYRLPKTLSKWLYITGSDLDLSEKKQFIRLMVTLMDNESRISMNWKTVIGDSIGPLQITKETYQGSIDYFSDSLLRECDSSVEGRKRVESILGRALSRKRGQETTIDLTGDDRDSIISSALNEIAPDSEHFLAFNDKEYAFEIGVITILYHIDFIVKNYNVQIDSEELRAILFASWNAGLEKPRETYLQYVLYSYSDQTNPSIVVDSFSSNPDILSRAGLTSQDITVKAGQYSTEFYEDFIDGNLSKVEIEMLARIILENEELATEVGLPFDQNISKTSKFLIDTFFNSEDQVNFKIKEMDSKLILFINRLSSQLNPSKNPFVMQNAMAAIPAAKHNRVLIRVGDAYITDPRLPEGSNTLGYVEALLERYNSLGPNPKD